jgi:hypothetical protein
MVNALHQYTEKRKMCVGRKQQNPLNTMTSMWLALYGVSKEAERSKLGLEVPDRNDVVIGSGRDLFHVRVEGDTANGSFVSSKRSLKARIIALSASVSIPFACSCSRRTAPHTAREGSCSRTECPSWYLPLRSFSRARTEGGPRHEQQRFCIPPRACACSSGSWSRSKRRVGLFSILRVHVQDNIFTRAEAEFYAVFLQQLVETGRFQPLRVDESAVGGPKVNQIRLDR